MRNGKQHPYKIRLSTNNGNRTIVVHASNPKKAVAKVKTKGRVMSVQKIAPHELFALPDEFVKSIITPDRNLLGFPSRSSDQ